MKPDVLQVVREASLEPTNKAAVACLLLGSHARGDYYPESDVDLTFIGRDAETYLERRRGYLVSVSWRSVDGIRASMNTPPSAGGMVGGLRSSYIVSDPQGVAATLKAEANTWRWDRIADQCDVWVAEQIVSLAEDAQRAFGHHKRGKRSVAAVFKGVLSARLAMILSVHLRIIYDSENAVWDTVADRMGSPWGTLQAASLSIADEPFDTSFRATMELYALAVRTVVHDSDERQLGVVVPTCEILGFPL